jgi:hypothetical protein
MTTGEIGVNATKIYRYRFGAPGARVLAAVRLNLFVFVRD